MRSTASLTGKRRPIAMSKPNKTMANKAKYKIGCKVNIDYFQFHGDKLEGEIIDIPKDGDFITDESHRSDRSIKWKKNNLYKRFQQRRRRNLTCQLINQKNSKFFSKWQSLLKLA